MIMIAWSRSTELHSRDLPFGRAEKPAVHHAAPGVGEWKTRGRRRARVEVAAPVSMPEPCLAATWHSSRSALSSLLPVYNRTTGSTPLPAIAMLYSSRETKRDICTVYM